VIAEAIEVDRMLIWKNQIIDDRLYSIKINEWLRNENVKKVSLDSIAYDELPSEFERILSSGQSFKGLVRDMSPEMQKVLTQQNVLSIIMVPLFMDDVFWGFMSLDDCIIEREFTAEENDILRSSGMLFVNAASRNDIIEQVMERDIVLERLVAERTKELAYQSTTLSTLFDSIPDIIFTKDINLNYTHCNKAFLDFFDLQTDDVLGKDDTYVLHASGEFLEKIREDDSRVMNSSRALMIEEVVPHADGEPVVFQTTKAPLILNDKAVGIVGIARDITHVKDEERKIAYNYSYTKKLSDALANITKSSYIAMGDVNTVAGFIAQEGCNVLNVHRISIWTISENADALINITCYEGSTGEHSVHGEFDLSHRPEYAGLLNSERLIVASNVEESIVLDDGYNPNLCAMLEAPIRIDGKLAGLVCADLDRCDEFPESREWLVEEKNFVSTLADIMALAISSLERREALDIAERSNQAKERHHRYDVHRKIRFGYAAHELQF
jgi:PAS domain S-box-containing protein